MSNLKKYYPQGILWQYLCNKEHACSKCGSNVYHHEYDGENIWGICNSCGNEMYMLKEEFVKSDLAEGEWK